MNQTQAALVMVLGAIAVLALMWWGWKNRQQRTAPLVAELPTAPSDLGNTIYGPIPGIYVSTTTHGDWLNRINANTLGDRSTVTVTVHQTGVYLDRPSATGIFIPHHTITGAALTPGIAGKFTGKDGIAVISWTIPTPQGDAVELDTGIRTTHKKDKTPLIDAITTLQGQAKESQ